MNAAVTERRPARLGVGLRHRLGGLHRGPGRAGGGRALRLARADRRGLALEADARRGAAPVGGAGSGSACTLDHHVDRLAEDHENAASRGRAPSRDWTWSRPTRTSSSRRCRTRPRSWGSSGTPASGHPAGARPRPLRDHLDVDREGIERSLAAFREVLRELSGLAKVCYVCGKGPSFGHSRSHSMVATKRRFNPNLQKVRIEVDGAPRRSTSPPAA